MADEDVIRNCSPTLAGIKTASLFQANYANKMELMLSVRSLNRRLAGKGLLVLPMRYSDGRALLYLYRPKRLAHDLADSEAQRLLRELGYESGSDEKCLARLSRRLRRSGDFPHEIGLFLGYPPEDVRGFIENKADNFKCVGTWKVYGDAEKAQKTFTLYRKCESVYRRQWSHGKTIEQLTVAV